ncbi:MAG: type II toxin-antitoxin system YafQ family toxin [Bryobacteraceae bacterium]|jgi:mRNA interferase YafQ
MGALEKDLRRVEKQRRDLDRLDELVNLLQARQPLPSRCRPHVLRGNWPGHWDCHVSPDWLLLYRVTETKSILVRTGSHAELFE